MARQQADPALVSDQARAGLDPAGFDPSRVEVLSLGKSDVGCTPQRWTEALSGFSPRARAHAANLAAHNWDVLRVGAGRVLLVSYYGGGHWLNPDLSTANTVLEPATADELDALYDTSVHPKVRRFCDSDGSPEGGDACGSVHDSAARRDRP